MISTAAHLIRHIENSVTQQYLTGIKMNKEETMFQLDFFQDEFMLVSMTRCE